MRVVKNKLIKLAGWYGVIAILLAYTLLTFNLVVAKSFAYQLLNLTGAVGIIIEAKSKKDMQPVVLNVIWLAVAGFAIVELVKVRL